MFHNIKKKKRGATRWRKERGEKEKITRKEKKGK